MKTLLLVRHAKSGWSDPTLTDHDRPLNERGREAAPLAGTHIAESGLVPDRILSSTAVRARTTAIAMAESCGFDGEVEEFRELYHSSPVTIADVVRRHAGDADRVMVVAHNPGCEEFVEGATGRIERFTTANIAEIAWEIDDWADLVLDGSADLVGLWRPRDE